MRGWMLVVWSVAVAGCQNPVQTLVAPDELLLTSQGQIASVSTKALDKEGRPVAAPVAFSSSDASVATVSAQGEITAHKSGDATVQLSAGQITRQIRVRVRIPARVVVLPETTVLTGLGSTVKMIARVLDESGLDVPGAALTWVVDGPEIASVVNGTVTALGVGACGVRASFGSLSAVSHVVVELPDFDSLELEPSELSLMTGQSDFVLASMTNADGKRVAGIPVEFVTSAPNVALVDSSGRVTGNSPGAATITARAGSLSASASVIVRVAK